MVGDFPHRKSLRKYPAPHIAATFPEIGGPPRSKTTSAVWSRREIRQQPPDAVFTYQYADDRTVGVNRDNRSHRLALTSSTALKYRLQLGGEAVHRNSKNESTIFLQERKGDFYQLTAGLIRDLVKHTRLILQYTHMRNNSTIDLYTYNRSLYTAGVEFYF
jgi:hypothetical protein